MIPDAAVEAAAKQLFAQDSGEAAWGEVREAIRNHYRGEVMSVLEAAAPHMLSEAWNEGKAATFADPVGIAFGDVTNPYAEGAK